MSCPRTTSTGWRAASPSLSRLTSMLALTALCACSSAPPKAQPPLVATLPPAATLPPLAPVSLESVRWLVVEVDGQPLISLKSKDYEALARNMAALAEWISQASWQLDFYRRSRGTPNSTTPGASDAAKHPE